MQKELRLALSLGITFTFLFLIREKLYFNPVAYTAHFADQRSYLGIPNFFDVITNLGFLWIGIFGFTKLKETPDSLRSLILIFLLALIGTAFGSAYFHWETSPPRLFWDQLPISIGFGSFVGMVIADRIHLRFGQILGIILCVLGPVSVWNIYYGNGATAPYLALQFGSLLLCMLLLIAFPQGELRRGPVFSGILIYILAKVFEHYDSPIFETLGFISGHSLKHIAATLALVSIFQGMKPSKN